MWCWDTGDMGAPVAFSRAVIDDLSAVEALVRAAYAPYVERIGREPAPVGADYVSSIEAGRVMLARSGAELVGVLVTVPAPDFLLVENVAVDSSRQGEGIGSSLLARAEAEARDLGLRELRLYTNVKMTENLDYYPRRGYRQIGRHREDGFDRVYFSRVLDRR